jgi:SAM-dependent methyltransferase
MMLRNDIVFCILSREDTCGRAIARGRVRIEEWNRRYRSREEINDEPAEVLVDSLHDVPPGVALDLACGAGRNAIWLARQGWSVTAVDGAEEAIRITLEQAAGLPVEAQVLDLENDAPLPFPDESFDLVAKLYYLHRPLFAEVKRLLRPGGLAVVAIRTSGINPRFCVAAGELREVFADWELVHQKENEIAEIVARKPVP